MPVPATTGVLRTRVQDMEIGDYVVWGMNNSTYFMGSDTQGNIETSVNGGNIGWNGYYWYGIKVAKGLIVSDRVIRHSITWDSLNTNKQIQGLPINFGNIIPTMTSNTSPSGVVSANNEVSGYEAWRAFNGIYNNSSGWNPTVDGGTSWLAYKFDSPILISGYAIHGFNSNGTPKDWFFEASNDGVNWVRLDRRDEQLFTPSSSSLNAPERKIYSFQNNKEYLHYRLNITSVRAGSTTSNRTYLSGLEMHETAGILRCLTGGVAYADANGNRSTTDLSTGKAFPANSEFDKYILGFDKIQPGKTLDDVFHHQPVRTWVQDTPILGIAAATNRVTRGGVIGTNNFGFLASSTANTTVGFRPVFSYKE